MTLWPLWCNLSRFKVKKGRRYVGVFTVRFKPSALKPLIAKHGLSVNENQARPVVVVPLQIVQGQPVVWDHNAMWRGAWEEAAKGASWTPLVVLPQDPANASVFKATDLQNGKSDVLQALMKKYQAGGVVIAVLVMDDEKPQVGQNLEMQAVSYDAVGRASEPVHVAVMADAKGAAFAQGVRQIREAIDHALAPTNKNAKMAASHLTVTVPIESLAMWNDIKQRLDRIPAFQKIGVLSLTRGAAKIDMEFQGQTSDLKEPLSAEGLILDNVNGAWTLQEGFTAR